MYFVTRVAPLAQPAARQLASPAHLDSTYTQEPASSAVTPSALIAPATTSSVSLVSRATLQSTESAQPVPVTARVAAPSGPTTAIAACARLVSPESGPVPAPSACLAVLPATPPTSPTAWPAPLAPTCHQPVSAPSARLVVPPALMPLPASHAPPATPLVEPHAMQPVPSLVPPVIPAMAVPPASVATSSAAPVATPIPAALQLPPAPPAPWDMLCQPEPVFSALPPTVQLVPRLLLPHASCVMLASTWRLPTTPALPAPRLASTARTQTPAPNALMGSTCRLSTVSLLASAWPAAPRPAVLPAETLPVSVLPAPPVTPSAAPSAFQILALDSN